MENERGGGARKRNWRDTRDFFFSPVWFSIRGTRGDKTKRTVTQRNNPSSVPSCSCSSSSSSSLSLTLSLSLSPSLSLSLQFPQIPAEIESLFTGTVCWHHPLHTEWPALSLSHPTTLLWQDTHIQTQRHGHFQPVHSSMTSWSITCNTDNHCYIFHNICFSSFTPSKVEMFTFKEEDFKKSWSHVERVIM